LHNKILLMKLSSVFYIFSIIVLFSISGFIGSGCAQIGMPTGGIKDTIAPVLVNASPLNKVTNFTGNKIILSFNEYVEVQDVFNNVITSPLTKKNAEINYKLRTVTIKLKDTLLPNTTYSINFGNAIKDINEGNIFPNFTYVFSTGNTIDSLAINGKIIMAETGKVDSTLLVLLYRNANDSSVQKRKPDYIAKLKGNGTFTFNNLPKASFKIYALKDGDGGKTYNSKTEPFAFLNEDVFTDKNNDTLLLNAFTQEKEKKIITAPSKTLEKKLKYSVSPEKQDILTPYKISLNNPLKNLDSLRLQLLDTNYNPITTAKILLDSTKKIITISNTWKIDEEFRIVLNKDFISDSVGTHLSKTDTLKIKTKTEADYANLVLRFKNLDLSKNSVLQLVVGDEVKYAYPITSKDWSNKFIAPGEYDIRILYDQNKNGIWDTGNYGTKTQPEKVISLPQKLSLRANWDNERDIEL
jgi:hypothetical protein